jgi:4-hydroxy-tetrahydrodipicolinate reductase
MIRLIISGACGRTGSAIMRMAAEDPSFDITHILEAPTHPLTGKPISVPGSTKDPLILESGVDDIISDCDVIINFAESQSCLDQFRIACKNSKAMIIGTTGFSADAMAEMRTTPGARAVISPNMSIGVNMLFSLVRKTAEKLGNDYDIEIVELHHNLKKDAPSGTAIKLRDTVKGTNPSRGWIEVTGRNGMVGQRKPDEIGVFAIRAGDIVGEHTVYFVGAGERIELTHRAYSRDNFAKGALTAAKWIMHKSAGIYGMDDVLGLE